MDNCSNNWFDKHLSNVDNFDEVGLNISNFNLKNVSKKINGLKPYIESSSSSTTHISENFCISKSNSLGENVHSNIYDDEEWTNSLESCFTRTLDDDFKELYQNCPHEASSKDSLEEQLNTYFSRTFGNYNSNINSIYVNKREGFAEFVNNHSKKPNDNHFISKGSSSNSINSMLFGNSVSKKPVMTNSNVSTDCGVCELNPVTNTSPSSASQLSDQVKNYINADSKSFTNFSKTKEFVTCPITTRSINGFSMKGSYASSVSYANSINKSNSSKFSFEANILTTQLSSSLLSEIFPSNEIQKTLSDLSNDTFNDSALDNINYFNKEGFNANDSYYKSLNNKDIDLIFNNMDSMSRVDNLLNKDVSDFNIQTKDLGIDLISDYNSDVVTADMLNNDALFSEVYRDNDDDDSEVWDNMMKKLCISSNLNKYYPKLINESKHDISNSTNLGYNDINDASEIGITLKNKDNIPSILPADPNLGFKKTSLCKYWQRGVCANDDCNFAHGKKELRSTIGVWRTTICHHWKTGICRVGKDCRHAHGEEELQPKNIPANVLKNKLLNSARRYEYMRKRKSTY